jgi:hypothetical protein
MELELDFEEGPPFYPASPAKENKNPLDNGSGRPAHPARGESEKINSKGKISKDKIKDKDAGAITSTL